MLRDRLRIEISDTAEAAGRAVALEIAAAIKELLSTRDEINIIVEPSPSLLACYRALPEDRSIDWSRINAFVTGEYIGLDRDAPQGLGNRMRKALFDKVPLRSAELINPSVNDTDAECRRYGALLGTHACDILITGIGDNGGLAFLGPLAADFCDGDVVKAVELDILCRRQQVNEGLFPTLDRVPTHAITLTVPTLLSAGRIFCLATGEARVQAIYDMLSYGTYETCPASALRAHPNAVLYLDKDSAKMFNYGCKK
ncbi:MAG: 6-phosphogluconolactonase [Clostridia bacterium]|nr:6-phosphogluconolactonase [Clostridia bacterium]